jgi:DNA-binding MarR family transcriptional regulator
MSKQRKSRSTSPLPSISTPGATRAHPDHGASGPAFTLAILLQHTGRLLEDQLRRGFDELGLHAAQGQVLHLLEWGDGVSQRELTRMMKVAAPTVSGILTRMEVEGLVERRIDSADERITRVFLTRKGRRKGEGARACVQRVEQALITGLTRAQLRSAHRLLRRLRENLGGEPPGTEPTVQQILP